MTAAFARAADASLPAEEHACTIAGLPVRIQIAGTVGASIVAPALAHLRDCPASASTPASRTLHVHVFDGLIPDGRMPGPPGRLENFTARGDVLGFDTERFKVAFQPFGRVLSAIDLERGMAYYWIGDPAGVMDFERAAPLRSILAWWLRQQGRQLLHAAAVGTAAGGVLLAGKGGSGKSNTALACLEAGLGYVSDDVCAVSTSPQPVAHSVFATGRTDARDWARLPFLEALAVRGGDRNHEKALYLLHPRYARQLLPAMPIRAILLPKIGTGRPFNVEPVARTETILALAPVTTTLLPGSGPEVFITTRELVRQVPCFRLDLGPEPARVVTWLREWLEATNAGAATAKPTPPG